LKKIKNIKEKINLLKKEVIKMFPDAKAELYFNNDFQLLIAVLMSAQTTDKQVNKANKEFFKYLKNPEDWIILWVEKIQNFIKTIWFFRVKSKNIFKTSQILSKKNLDDFNTVSELIKLPWVWIKTAKVFLSVARWGQYLAVDTHVHRVLNRFWIVDTNSPEKTDKEAEKIFTKKDLWILHHWLIFFGRYHCLARKPKCEKCPLKTDCKFFNVSKKN